MTPFVVFVALIILLMFGAHLFSGSEYEDDEDYGSCEGETTSSTSCNPSPKSWNSCCSRNPIIVSQMKSIDAFYGKLCEGPGTIGCVCIPNIGSMYVGATIASARETVPYNHPEGLPTSALSNRPELTIDPSLVTPGKNWHFVGVGTLVIKLFRAAQISGVSIIHPSKCRVPDGLEKSAPKHFQVYGLHRMDDPNPFPYGNFTYDVYKNQPAQTFPVQNCTMDKYQLIEFRFTANHGNPDYTALYKIEIHGDMNSKAVSTKSDNDEDDTNSNEG